MSYIIDGKKISDILAKSDCLPLESEFDIEDLILYIKKNRTEIEFCEQLKKRRTASIDAEIARKEEQNKILEKTILATIEKVGKKSLNFPGIGKVTKTSRKGKWVIEDENVLLESLKEKDQMAYDSVITSKISLDKAALNQILDQREKIGDLPLGVKKDAGSDSVKLSFESDLDIDTAQEDSTPNGDIRTDNTKLDVNLDRLEI